MMPGFKHLRTRILVFVLGLLSAVLGSFYFAVNTANVSNARAHIEEALELTVSALERSLEDREQNLFHNVRLLSGDYAFKTAFATSEHQTILSALDNHRVRVGADVMLLVSFDDEIIADTLHPELDGEDFQFPELTLAAEGSDYGEASMIGFIDGVPYQLVVVPLFTPDPSAWIVIGFVIDDAFARRLQESTRTQVSILYQPPEAANWTLFTSTLEGASQALLEQSINRGLPPADKSISMRFGHEEFVSLVTRIGNGASRPMVAVLQRSLRSALEPYLRLRRLLALIVAAGLLLSIAGVYLIARSITRPVDVLAEGAERIEQGDYSTPVVVRQRDELGGLAGSFNSMMKGLEERRRVRSLLGKVVSPAIAEELLSRKIELGGEERQVTVLFSDVRGFTSLCEGAPPGTILNLLNRYLTRMTAVIEAHGGVVDKYIGDAIMALFGAPLQMDDEAGSAVLTAMDMCGAAAELNAELAAEGSPPLHIGIGVNTGQVVAGNMGSETRLNYTVIGDAVNIASRVEGLTKRYGVEIIVTGATRDQCRGIVFRELDRVRVKGKLEPVTLHEPLGREGELDAEALARLELHQRAIADYLAGAFDAAAQAFGELNNQRPEAIHAVYMERIERFRADPPGNDWDGVFLYNEK